MLDAAREAIAFTAGRSLQEFSADRMLALAVLKSIEIIGEAASRVSDETRSLLPDLPWGQMVGIRNRLVHGYFDIDHERVWTTVKDDLGPLVRRLALFLESEQGR
jgi:uncharacterized protein with HEPN domain